LSNNVPDVALTTNEENFFLLFNFKQNVFLQERWEKP